MGLGLAYAGAQNEQIRSILTPILGDNKASLDVIAFAAISLGLVYVGSCNEEIAQAIIFSLMERIESELGDPLSRLLPLGLGLLYLGKQESVEATAEVSKTFHEKIRKHCDMTLLSCAYAGTGNVLKVQHFLGECAQHLEKGESYQGAAVLGIAMVAMSEELGLEMTIRSLEHLLQYGDQNIRRAVPLALGLLCISNPKVNVMDTLSRLSHDSDTEVAMAAIISLGLIGAGTNNARIAGILRNLSSYHYKEANLLFCLRIAQGLVHLGKGLMTLSPYHLERFLLSPTALAGLIAVLHICLDMKAIILGKYHYVLYFLTLAMQPRMLMTVDENLKPLSVPVRVGQAVDVIGQAGRPKTITGLRILQFSWYCKSWNRFLCDFCGKSSELRNGCCSKNDFDGKWSEKMKSCKTGLLMNSNLEDEKNGGLLELDDEKEEFEEECNDEYKVFDVLSLRKIVKMKRRRASVACLELEKERMTAATAKETMWIVLIVVLYPIRYDYPFNCFIAYVARDKQKA
ncbi:26S proteasome non-ATPase regulatory subunit 2 [Capsicum chinense]|nr:26S proteasome non-ATPase regulatory subunit 2 [Capsicum chinense]